MNGVEDAAGVAVVAVLGAVVADARDDVAHDGLDVHPRLRADLARDDGQAGGHHRLARATDLRHVGGLAVGRDIALVLKLDLLLEDRVQDGVRDLVADLIGMALGDGFGREKIGVVLFCGHEAPPSSLSAVPP